MKIFSCHTPAHEVLHRGHFLQTLPAEFEPHSEKLEIAGQGDFLSREFMACIRRKIELILESIAKNPGELIVWSDVDIEFHLPIADELAEFADQSGRAILFQREAREGGEVNTGFFVCRCGPAAEHLFRAVQSELAAHPDWNEQRAVNELLASRRWTDAGHLPMTYYARTHGWPPPRDLRIYHANYTQGRDGVRQKIRQFGEARRYLAGGRLTAALSYLRIASSKSPAELIRALARRAMPGVRR